MSTGTKAQWVRSHFRITETVADSSFQAVCTIVDRNGKECGWKKEKVTRSDQGGLLAHLTGARGHNLSPPVETETALVQRTLPPAKDVAIRKMAVAFATHSLPLCLAPCVSDENLRTNLIHHERQCRERRCGLSFAGKNSTVAATA